IHRNVSHTYTHVVETTPLHVAARYDCKHILGVLLKIPGANVNARDYSGQTPLMTWCINRDGYYVDDSASGFLSTLLAAGADASMGNRATGELPLHLMITHSERATRMVID
ncbi:hypothetical protein T484DRAFT_1564339, partial [Baffinella frigidus]